MGKASSGAWIAASIAMFVATRAYAQQPQPGAPLPPLPPSQPQYPQGQPPPPPPQGYPPPQGAYGQPQQYSPPQYGPPPQYQQQPYYQPPPPPPPPGYPPPPPPVEYNEPPEPTHAPKFSLWVGGRLGVLGFGGAFYQNEFNEGETTGNFVRNGLSLGVDVGARLGKRYLPYVFLEHGFMGQGHRFEGSDATSSSDLLGLGFRYTAGDVDSVGFLTDISVGMRTITVKGGGSTYKMSSLEIFRLGLGAEIRISTLFVLSPMATLSGGAMSDTESNSHIAFSAEGSRDGITHPTYENGKQISNQRGYIAVGLQCGAHFDVFGK